MLKDFTSPLLLLPSSSFQSYCWSSSSLSKFSSGYSSPSCLLLSFSSSSSSFILPTPIHYLYRPLGPTFSSINTITSSLFSSTTYFIHHTFLLPFHTWFHLLFLPFPNQPFFLSLLLHNHASFPFSPFTTNSTSSSSFSLQSPPPSARSDKPKEYLQEITMKYETRRA